MTPAEARPVAWGVLGAARIALDRVIPAMQASPICAVQMTYTHTNDDPGDIRNRPAAGGGSLLDVGCYCTTLARLLFSTEPVEVVRFEPVNQYTLQGERFSRRVRGEDVPVWPLEGAWANMRVVDALRRSAHSGAVETVAA